MQLNEEKAVERIAFTSITERLFTTKYRCKRPLVITGFLDSQQDDKNIVKSWSDEYLSAKLWRAESGGSPRIEAFRSRDNMHFVDQEDVVERVPMSFDEMLAIVSKKETPASILSSPDATTTTTTTTTRLYYRSLLFEELQPLVPHPTELLYETNKDLKGFSRSLQMLWVGVEGCITSLHYDRCHGILVQVRGKKRAHLFSPKHTPSLYPHSPVSTKAHLARVPLSDMRDASKRDEAIRRFPLFAAARSKVAELSAGDLLYIPPGYWHEVETLENSISVTIPWDLRPEEQPPRHMYA